MRKLYKFFSTVAHPFFFLILLSTCIICIYRTSDYKQWAITSLSKEIASPLFKLRTKYTELLDIRAENERLSTQNRNLLTLLYNHNRSADNIDTVYHGDSLLFIYHSAKIVESVIHKRNNYILLDKGFNDGIRNEWGVISPEGVVGIIKDVSPNFSVVLPVLSTQFSVIVKIKNTSASGILTWDAENIRYAQINNLPHIENVNVGDTVVTQYSMFLPPDYPVGIVTSFNQKTVGGFFMIKVRLFVPFDKLSSVYIIEQRYSEELEYLMERANINE